MKALMCADCMDIRALDPSPKVAVVCRCGNCSARWVDPNKGTVAVTASNKKAVRILGLNNSFLLAGIAAVHDAECRFWHELHLDATDAPGYIFDAKKRCCWAAIIGSSKSISK